MVGRSVSGGEGGFTLVELLVVVAIISVLAAFLMPALTQAIEQARRTECMNQLKQVGMAANLYADAYMQWLPNWQGDGTNSHLITVTADATGTIPPIKQHREWLLVRYGYLEEIDLFYCPTAASVYGGSYERSRYPSADLILHGGHGKGSSYHIWGGYSFAVENFRTRNSPVPNDNEFRLTRDGDADMPFAIDHADYNRQAHGNGWNALRVDGRVEWWSDPGGLLAATCSGHRGAHKAFRKISGY